MMQDDYFGDPDDDVSGLLAWVDDDGRMFAIDVSNRVVEVADDTDLSTIFPAEAGGPVPHSGAGFLAMAIVAIAIAVVGPWALVAWWLS